MINGGRHPRFAGAVCTAKECALSLDAMAEDLATAVLADGGELLNRALKTVEDVVNASGYDFKGQVVVIPAHFAPGHGVLLFRPQIRATTRFTAAVTRSGSSSCR